MFVVIDHFLAIKIKFKMGKETNELYCSITIRCTVYFIKHKENILDMKEPVTKIYLLVQISKYFEAYYIMFHYLFPLVKKATLVYDLHSTYLYFCHLYNIVKSVSVSNFVSDNADVF